MRYKERDNVSNSNGIADSLLKAIQTVVDHSVNNIVADITITATIKELKSAATNKYLISYTGGEAYAYAENGFGYTPNDLVYVLIPEGNYANKKIILSKAKANTDNVTSDDLSAIANSYNIVDTNLFSFDKNYSIDLCSYKAIDEFFVWTSDKYRENMGLSESDLTENVKYIDNIIDEQNFENLIKNASAIMIKSNVKTNLDTAHRKSTTGQYGLCLGIVYSDGNNQERYEQLNFTSRDMMGNPLNFFYGSDQYKIFKIDGKNFKRIDYLVAYSNGFVDNFQKKNDDIFFRNLELNILTPITSRNGDYLLTMQAPSGFTIKAYNTAKEDEEKNGPEKTDEIEFFAKTTYKNSNISDKCTYYWAIEDLSVNRYSKSYNIYTGNGWKILNSSNSKRFVTTGVDNPAYENNYKCVSVYDSDGTLITLEEKFVIYNNNNKLECYIESSLGTSFQFNVGSPVLTCHVEDDSNLNDYRFIWKKEDLNGSCILNQTKDTIEAEKEKAEKEIQESKKDPKVDSLGRTATTVLTYYNQLMEENQYAHHDKGIYSNELKYDAKGLSSLSSTTFTCIVQRALDTWVNAGRATITLTNDDVINNSQYRIVIENGAQVFQYSETGISPASKSNQDPIKIKQLSAKFFDTSGEDITDYCSFKWIIPKDNTMIIPAMSVVIDKKDSNKEEEEENNVINEKDVTLLFDNVSQEQYITGKDCAFKISDNYNLNSLNNQIICCAFYQGQEFRQPTNFLFTKVGEVGTNGTQTTVKITENINSEYYNYHLALIKSKVPQQSSDNQNSDNQQTPSENQEQTDVQDSENSTVQNDNQELIQEQNASWHWNYLRNSEEQPFTAELYTHNEKVFGYSPKWSLAGMNGSSSARYVKISSDGNDYSKIDILEEPNNSRDDVRILTAKINFDNKTYYNSYPIYTIEYEDGFDEQTYPIDIKNPETLQYITYDSNGTNPQFNTAQGGIFLERDWEDPERYYVNWEAYGGVEVKNGDEWDTNPAIKLSTIPGSSVGSQCIKRELDGLNDIASTIFDIEESIEGMHNTDSKNETKALYNSIKYHLTNSLIDNMEQRVLNAKEILEKLKTTSEAWSIGDKTIVDIVYSKLNEKFNIIISEINEHKIYNIISQKRYDNILNYLNGVKKESIQIYPYEHEYQNEDGETVKEQIEIPYGNYKTVIKEFWESIKQDLLNKININQSEYNNLSISEEKLNQIIERNKDGYWLNEIFELITTKRDENGHKKEFEIYETFFNDENPDPVAQIHDNCWDKFLEFSSKFKSFKFSTEEVSSNLGSLLIGYLSGDKKLSISNEIYIVPAQTYSGTTCNHRVIATVYKTKDLNEENDTKIATITIPIHLSLNTYELASVNGWDGTHIEINDKEDYILAPQIGAGIKNSQTNSFTGLVMGSISNKTENGYASEKVGLMGFSEGKQSVFIDAKTGSAEFGLAADGSSEDRPYSEGRIKLTPGGTSEISQWKIGRDSLYNVVNGDVGESYKDLKRYKEYKKSIPHTKSGVMLSADPAYLSIKGRTLNDNDGIDFLAANAVVKKGDTLELQLDAQLPSIFTIYRHTSKFDSTVFEEKTIDGKIHIQLKESDDALKPKDSLKPLEGNNEISVYKTYKKIEGKEEYKEEIYYLSFNSSEEENKRREEILNKEIPVIPNDATEEQKERIKEEEEKIKEEKRNVRLELSTLSIVDIETEQEEWRREPKVGIDSNGRFYTNALKDNTTALTIGSLGAFGSQAMDKAYIGASFEIGTDLTTNELLKIFTKASEVNEADGTLYLSGATSKDNEYQRPMQLYGKQIKLYASSSSHRKDSSDNYLILNGNKGNKNGIDGIRLQNQNGTYLSFKENNFELHADSANYINLIDKNMLCSAQGNISIEGWASSNTSKKIAFDKDKLNISSNNIINIEASNNLSQVSSNGEITITSKATNFNNSCELKLNRTNSMFSLSSGAGSVISGSVAGGDSKINLSSQYVINSVSNKVKIDKIDSKGGELEVEGAGTFNSALTVKGKLTVNGSNNIIDTKKYDSHYPDSNHNKDKSNYRIPIIITDSNGVVTFEYGEKAASSTHTHSDLYAPKNHTHDVTAGDVAKAVTAQCIIDDGNNVITNNITIDGGKNLVKIPFKGGSAEVLINVNSLTLNPPKE